MRGQQHGKLLRIAVPILAGAMLGTVGAVGYAVICSVIGWLFTGNMHHFVPWVIRFAPAGSIAGTVMGVCLAIDWSRDGAAEARAVTAPAEPGLETVLPSAGATRPGTRLWPYWARMRMHR